MRNKGFFWGLTILLLVVCLYQLSFTWYASSEEKLAAKEAKAKVKKLKLEAANNKWNVAIEFRDTTLTGIVSDSLEYKSSMDTAFKKLTPGKKILFSNLEKGSYNITVKNSNASLGEFRFELGDYKNSSMKEDSSVQKINALGLIAKIQTSNRYNRAMLPNKTEVDFSKQGSDELAQAAYVSQILMDRADKTVDPIFGSTFATAKKRSISFGLDLVGGMSVTLEISASEMILKDAKNPKDPTFKKIFNKAKSNTKKNVEFLDEFEKAANEEGKKLTGLLKCGGQRAIDESEVISYYKSAMKEALPGVQNVMERRINQFGVAQPNIQKEVSTNRLYIELPGVLDENTVAEKLRSTANLEFFETFRPTEIAAKMTEINEMSKQPSSPSANDATSQGLNSLIEAMDGCIGMVSKKNKELVTRILERTDVKESLAEANIRMMWGAKLEEQKAKGKKAKSGYYLYACEVPEGGEARVNGKHIQPNGASKSFESGWKVNLKMTDEGSIQWGEMTSENVGQFVAITMDNLVYSAPFVKVPIRGGITEITGSFSTEEAADLVGLLNGGALDAPCVITELNRVGPSIGAENSRAGLISFVVAFIAVLFYMFFYYGKSGLAANIALLANVVFIMGCLASFGAVLTLAGIAGIILTIGTAVDANILIFERIREEQRAGVETSKAISVGFQRALPSIIDANMTHLLVAFILFYFGVGEIKSFATTLIIGIFTSVFSAIFISRLVITWWMDRNKGVSFDTKYSRGLFQGFKFDWMGKRKYFYIFSLVVTIIGLVGFFSRGLKESVEFTGGRTYKIEFSKKADIEKIRKSLESTFVENNEIASIDLKTVSNEYTVEVTTNYMLSNAEGDSIVPTKLDSALNTLKADCGVPTRLPEQRTVSASVSSELWDSSIISMTVALIAIFLYILIRFGRVEYAIGTLISLFHDAFVVIAVFSLLHGILPFSLDVNQAFIAAVLTVIGYSMNDTVIVFDRIRENLRGVKIDTQNAEIINKSLNTTLSRTFNTSMILFVVVLIMFIFGGASIKGFLFALLVGVVIGTYSSLCVASPIMYDFSRWRSSLKKNKAATAKTK
jgi:SecD/SecF fusion protein